MSDIDSTDEDSATNVDFYDLAAKFTEETSRSSQPHRLLKIWAHRFPEHAADLAAIAYARLAQPAAGTNLATAADGQVVVESAKRLLDRFHTTPKPLNSIVTEALSSGLAQGELAKQLRVDIPLLAKLEQRLLDVSTIPSRLIHQLATSINRTSADVITYLSSPPRLAMNADYKSKRTPEVDTERRQSFVDAVKQSRMLSVGDREYWLDELTDSETAQ
jgi:hypothetical protein